MHQSRRDSGDTSGLFVVLVEDQHLVRDGMVRTLESLPLTARVESASSATEALEFLSNTQPDVMLIDMELPDLPGVELARRIRREHPRIALIGISGYSDRGYSEAMFELGAEGFIPKAFTREDLDRAIHAVTDGRRFFPDPSSMDAAKSSPGPGHEQLQQLTDREREVLSLIATGATTRQIAERLDVSVKTVETHRRNVMHKIGLFSIAELTKFAIRFDLTSL